MGVLYLSDNDDAVQASYAVDVSQGVEHEVLVVFHVVRIHLDLEVVVAGGVVALRYSVYRLNRVHELLNQVVCVLLESNVA